jgi:hypothetical protein
MQRPVDANGTIEAKDLIVIPDKNVIEIVPDKTTYLDLYQASYKYYPFPTQSLQNNMCVAFCDDGFASVNGICLRCSSPCETCKSEVTRCQSCR